MHDPANPYPDFPHGSASGVVIPTHPATFNRGGQFINVVEAAEEFPWQYTDDTGRRWDSVFTLRTVPEEFQKQLRKKHLRTEFKRGQRHEVMDNIAFADACLDYAIVGWVGIRHPKKRDANGQPIDLPCTPEWKRQLPERIQAEIVRLCVGKELGNELDDAEETKTDRP